MGLVGCPSHAPGAPSSEDHRSPADFLWPQQLAQGSPCAGLMEPGAAPASDRSSLDKQPTSPRSRDLQPCCPAHRRPRGTEDRMPLQ